MTETEIRTMCSDFGIRLDLTPVHPLRNETRVFWLAHSAHKDEPAEQAGTNEYPTKNQHHIAG